MGIRKKRKKEERKGTFGGDPKRSHPSSEKDLCKEVMKYGYRVKGKSCTRLKRSGPSVGI